jgi:hypothetical protein
MNRDMVKSHMAKRTKRKEKLSIGGAEEDARFDLTKYTERTKQGDNQRDNQVANPILATSNAGSEEGAISKLINNFFMLAAFAGGVCLVVLVILSIVNFARIRSVKKKQDRHTRYNSIIIRDTFEYQLLDYAKSPSTKENVLKVNALIYVSNLMMYIVGYAYVLPYIIISVVLLLFYFKETDVQARKDMSIRFNPVIGVAMATYFAVAIVTIIIIKFVFREKAINGVLNVFNKGIYDLRERIYSNLYVDNAYLDRLASGNFAVIANTIKAQMGTNMVAATRMVFTYNIYKHYANSFTASSPYLEDFNNRFTVGGLKKLPGKDRFDPVEFLLYDDNPEVLIFQDHFMKDLDAMIGVSNEAIYTDTKNTYTARRNGTSIYQEVNTRLSKVNTVAKTFLKSNLQKIHRAMYNVAIAMFVFMIIVLATIVIGATMVLNSTEKGRMALQQLYNTFALAYNTLYSFIMSIASMIKSIINAIRGRS